MRAAGMELDWHAQWTITADKARIVDWLEAA